MEGSCSRRFYKNKLFESRYFYSNFIHSQIAIFVTNNGTQISIPLSIAPFDRKEQWTVQGRIAPSYPDGEKYTPTIKPSKPHIRYKPTTCCLP